MSATVPPLVLRQRDLFVCPACAAPLAPSADGAAIACAGCHRSFGCEEGIPRLFVPNEWGDVPDVTEAVRGFYAAMPFPDYEDLESAVSLEEKARRGVFARLLDEQIPDDARVLEAGCGTGQLGNFLALAPRRTVVASDASLPSLRLAQAFKQRHGIEAVTFVEMNLFRPALRAASFDLVICTGVLHHTSAPRCGFRSLARLVRPGGFFVLGLYNRLGRLPNDLRRLLFRLTGDRLRFLDRRLRRPGLGERRRQAWWADQYRHPHESKHSIGEVLRWFDEAGFDFVSGIPDPHAFEPWEADRQLFAARPRGTRLDHLLVQLGMLVRGGREGGLFLMIGRRQ